VAFVTFDKMAFLIDPDGALGTDDPNWTCADENPDAELIDHDDDPTTPERTAQTHMIQSRCRAARTLDTYIGVRAEPNSYVWKEDGGGWTAFADGLDEEGNSKFIDYTVTNPADVDTDAGEVVPLNTYPVRDHCPLQNGALGEVLSRYSLWERGKWEQYGSAKPGLYRIMIPDPTTGTWAGSGIDERNSYELWSSCRNTNIGAALRTGSNALLDPSTTRRTGTVWVMVLLGDGAAGGSDPVRQDGRPLRDGSFVMPGGGNSEISVYADKGTDKSNWESWGCCELSPPFPPDTPFTQNIRYGTNDPGMRTQYGVFGVCPPGTPGARTSLTRVYGDGDVAYFPFCSDIEPHTRHFCQPLDKDEETVSPECPDGAPVDTELGDLLPASEWSYGFAPGAKDRSYICNPSAVPAGIENREAAILEWNIRRGNVYDVDIGDWPNNEAAETADTCDPYYDVDDYARDWADYIGLSKGGLEQQLPIIFTIGFGLNFEIGSNGLPPDDPGYVPGSQGQNVPDYLGEELLRYIADVGDNNLIDTDYQQDYLEDDKTWGVTAITDFGPRGPCEQDLEPMEAPPGYTLPLPVYAPLPARQSCGNYYNAPSEAQLQLVFDDIASRMFTRLTG
jgi:hypothetical protein